MGVRADVQMTVLFGEVMESILAGTMQGLSQAGEHLLAEAVDRAPMDQGDLRNSGAVSSTREGKGMEVQVVFDTPYAARLHEHPEYKFSTDSNPNAQGKYLENAATENKAVIGDIIREAARKGEISG